MCLSRRNKARNQSNGVVLEAYYPPPPGPPPRPPTLPPLSPPLQPPPEWTAAPELSHADGLHEDATPEDFTKGEEFCARHPLDPPQFIPPASVALIAERRCGAWSLVAPRIKRFVGNIEQDYTTKLTGSWRITTGPGCHDTCILSNLPILGGLYEVPGDKRGVYFEVAVHRMDGVIAIGTACKPYPSFRLPGWNRQSAALHLDDMRKFYEDPDGGRDYATDRAAYPGCTVGCGYEFAAGVLFFTFNGERLPDAFRGLYMPHTAQDVYVAIGVDGVNSLEVNFGTASFAWKEGNKSAWSIDGHVGKNRRVGMSADTEELPAYSRQGY